MANEMWPDCCGMSARSLDSCVRAAPRAPGMAGAVSALSCDRGHVHPVKGWSREHSLILSPNSICLRWYLECSHFVFSCPRHDTEHDASQRQTRAHSVIRVGRRQCLHRRETVDGRRCLRVHGAGGGQKENLHLRSHHGLSWEDPGPEWSAGQFSSPVVIKSVSDNIGYFSANF